MSPKGPLTVEMGRAMQARARRYMLLERAGVIAAGVAIPLFFISYLELRRIDVAVLAGAERTIPYLAYSSIALFVGGFVLIKVARHAIATISRALAAEQQRRSLESLEGVSENDPA